MQWEEINIQISNFIGKNKGQSFSCISGLKIIPLEKHCFFL